MAGSIETVSLITWGDLLQEGVRGVHLVRTRTQSAPEKAGPYNIPQVSLHRFEADSVSSWIVVWAMPK